MLLAIPISGSGQKISVPIRLIAKFIDLAIVFILAVIVLYPLGPLLGFAYSLVCDGMPIPRNRGQSVGKKLMRIRVINVKTKRPAKLRDSILRNAPVGIATFFGIIPFWGWIILALLGIPLMIMEIYIMMRVETGHRLGDVMGDTEVVSESA